MKFLFCMLIMFSRCSGTSHYIENRGNDFADIPILGFEENVYGASMNFWCLGGGIQYVTHGEGVGIRNGHIGNYRLGGKETFELYHSRRGSRKLLSMKNGSSFLIANSFEHKAIEGSERAKLKNYSYSNTFIFVPHFHSCHAPLSIEFSGG